MAQLMLGILLFAFGVVTLIGAARECSPDPGCLWDRLALACCNGCMGVGAWVVLLTFLQWYVK